MSVKTSHWLKCAKTVLLAGRTRPELKRLKAEHEKLQQHLLQVEQVKVAIVNWTRKHK